LEKKKARSRNRRKANPKRTRKLRFRRAPSSRGNRRGGKGLKGLSRRARPVRRRGVKRGKIRLKRWKRAGRRVVRARRNRQSGKVIPSSAYDWLFHHPSVDAKLPLDRLVWDRLRHVLPPHYAIPDKDFIRMVRARTGMDGGVYN
jgi:hypothetical protein